MPRISIEYLKEHHPDIVRELRAEGARTAREVEERKKARPEAMSEAETAELLEAYDPHVAAAFRRGTDEEKAHIRGLFAAVRAGTSPAEELQAAATDVQVQGILHAGGGTRRSSRRGPESESEAEAEASPENETARILDAGKKTRTK